MFKGFKKKSEEKGVIEISPVTPPLPPERFEEPAYQIGITESGKTTLRIGYSTLTMNKAGVHKLIQMLEVAVEAQTSETEGHDGRGPG